MPVAPEFFDPRDPVRLARGRWVRQQLARFNTALDPWGDEARDTLASVVGRMAAGVWIEAPFFCEYGTDIAIGADTFINTGCVMLDAAPITIGAHVLIAPNVQLLTVGHPVAARDRIVHAPAEGAAPYRTHAAPIVIEDEVWLGAGCIVMPGVRIGRGTTVGAGAVVTRDLPDNVLALGSPARIAREL